LDRSARDVTGPETASQSADRGPRTAPAHSCAPTANPRSDRILDPSIHPDSSSRTRLTNIPPISHSNHQPRKVACKVVSAHAEPKQIAVAGVAAAAILLDASASLAFTNIPTAAPDASTLYKKVEPERASKTRFDGTEVARLKAQAGKGGGKTAPSPKAASSKSAPASKSSKKKSSKKKSDSSASSGGALAAVVALGGLFAANATRGGDSSSSGSSKPKPAGGASNADANAKDAQKWIDDWKGSAPAGGADTPEGRAAEAQAWIDAWKAKQ
jgi:hypothetical protein